jgi:uncharacterized protein
MRARITVQGAKPSNRSFSGAGMKCWHLKRSQERIDMAFNKEEIIQLTQEYGKDWGTNHTLRLLHLISIIGEGRHYDQEVIWISAYLHDWGGYGKWAQPGVDHAVRSTEVAREFMEERDFPEETVKRVLECIATHHSGDQNRSFEARLLSDADGLDFLGSVGIFRDISKNPREIRQGVETIKKRMQKIPAQLCLEKSRQMAKIRLEEMQQILEQFEASSFGYY